MVGTPMEHTTGYDLGNVRAGTEIPQCAFLLFPLAFSVSIPVAVTSLVSSAHGQGPRHLPTVIPYSRNGTNALAGALAEVVNAIRPPALSATTPITDPCSAAMVIVEREEGFSDEDFACAARCIVASAELATTYVALKSQGTCTALIRGTMEMYQSSK
ncbi:hypothetical protein BJY52DRAFT_1423363 [Lactarius psammicola]|nr:hypothetical protein BJY52DRAFT_1423363 [Lactarius psammicola]